MRITSFRGYCFSVLFLVLSNLFVMQYGAMGRSYQDLLYQSQSIPKNGEGNLILIRNRIKTFPPGSRGYIDAKKELDDVLATIKHEDDSFARIGKFLLKNKNSSEVKNNNIKYAFNSCYKSLLLIYSNHCGDLSIYGLEHGKDIHNMCDAGVTESQLTEASIEACST